METVLPANTGRAGAIHRVGFFVGMPAGLALTLMVARKNACIFTTCCTGTGSRAYWPQANSCRFTLNWRGPRAALFSLASQTLLDTLMQVHADAPPAEFTGRIIGLPLPT